MGDGIGGIRWERKNEGSCGVKSWRRGKIKGRRARREKGKTEGSNSGEELYENGEEGGETEEYGRKGKEIERMRVK